MGFPKSLEQFPIRWIKYPDKEVLAQNKFILLSVSLLLRGTQDVNILLIENSNSYTDWKYSKIMHIQILDFFSEQRRNWEAGTEKKKIGFSCNPAFLCTYTYSFPIYIPPCFFKKFGRGWERSIIGILKIQHQLLPPPPPVRRVPVVLLRLFPLHTLKVFSCIVFRNKSWYTVN